MSVKLKYLYSLNIKYMHHNINNTDYKKILNYYGINIPKSANTLKKTAEDILAEKLCSCIKKVGGKDNESRAIGVCTRTVLNKKGLSRGKFKCTGRKNISLIKTKQKLSIGKKTKKRR